MTQNINPIHHYMLGRFAWMNARLREASGAPTAVTAALACEDACCGYCRLLAAAASVSALSFRRDGSCCRSDHDGLHMHRRRRAGVVGLMGQWDCISITIYVAAQYGVVILTPVLRLDGRTTAAAMATKSS